MRAWLIRGGLVAMGVTAMYVEGSNQDAPGIGFAIAMTCFIASVFVNRDGSFS